AFAAKPGVLLEQIHPDLVASDGQLLKHFLTRFFYATTIPNPRIAILLPDASEEQRSRLAAEHRVPANFPASRAGLDWLAAHVEDVFAHAADEFLDLAEAWLLLCRALGLATAQSSTSQMALALAERAAAAGRSWPRVASNLSRIYKLAILAAPADPD